MRIYFEKTDKAVLVEAKDLAAYVQQDKLMNEPDRKALLTVAGEVAEIIDVTLSTTAKLLIYTIQVDTLKFRVFDTVFSMAIIAGFMSDLNTRSMDGKHQVFAFKQAGQKIERTDGVAIPYPTGEEVLVIGAVPNMYGDHARKVAEGLGELVTKSKGGGLIINNYKKKVKCSKRKTR